MNFSEHELIASVCRDSFYQFIREMWDVVVADKPVWNWHIEVLAGELQKLAEHVIASKPRPYDLIINQPPATTKSLVASVMLPAWIWTRMPHCRVIGASYSYSLAVDLSRKCRDVIKSDKYRKCFPHVRLREDADAKGYFINTAGGDRFTASVNGMVTGMHGHILIVDDPLDPEQAFSEAELKIANRWMTHTLPSRKVDKTTAPVILVQQRLHANDPTGEMLDKAKKAGAFPVRRIRIPADDSYPIEPPELAANYKDGLLDPIRLPRSVLEAERANSEYSYRSQYGQDPQPAGGGMFKDHFFNQRVKAAPYHSQRIRYWDRACLLGSTLVATKHGPRRIDQIRAGDLVLTRKGYRRVNKAWMTKKVTTTVRVDFSNGSSVEGTEDHLVWTKNRGWVELADLDSGCYGHSIEEVKPCRVNRGGVSAALTPKSWNSTESFTPGGLVGAISRRTAGIRKRSGTGATCTTAPCGGVSTVLFPVAVTFITRTATGTTTRSTIWSASTGPTTTEFTTLSSNGTPDQRRSSNAGGPSPGGGNWPSTASTTACSVIASSSPDGSMRRLNTAPPCAEAGIAVPVYDLEVEGEHEFFADGILVHNSTASDSANAATAAYTAGVLMAKGDDGNYYVEDVVHGQWEPDERNKVMRAVALRDKARYGDYSPVIWVEREGGSSGRDAWKGVARALAGFDVREDAVSGRKAVRAEPWASQLAAGNVYLVEDGNNSWDINGYVEEHCLFPNGKLLDRVDSSSGAFNLLAGVKRLQGIQVRRIVPADPRRKTVKFLTCREEELPLLELEGPYLVVSLGDRHHDAAPNVPENSESLAMGFADVDPADLQDRWSEPVDPYQLPPEEILLTKEEAKKVWVFLTRQRPSNPSSVVFCETGGTARALSVALAVCDALRMPRDSAFALADGVDNIGEAQAPNRHVYETVRSARSLAAR